MKESQIGKFLELCGGNELDTNQIYVALKRAEHDNILTYQGFVRSLENQMNDVKIDPYVVVETLLKMYFKTKKVSIAKLDKFFKEFATYFEPGDVGMLIREAKVLIRGEENKILITEIASLVRNGIEGYSK